MNADATQILQMICKDLSFAFIRFNLRYLRSPNS